MNASFESDEAASNLLSKLAGLKPPLPPLGWS